MNSPATPAMTTDNTQKTKEKWKLAWSTTGKKSEYFAANTATDTRLHTTEKKAKTTLDLFCCLFVLFLRLARAYFKYFECEDFTLVGKGL